MRRVVRRQARHEPGTDQGSRSEATGQHRHRVESHIARLRIAGHLALQWVEGHLALQQVEGCRTRTADFSVASGWRESPSKQRRVARKESENDPKGAAEGPEWTMTRQRSLKLNLMVLAQGNDQTSLVHRWSGQVLR